MPIFNIKVLFQVFLRELVAWRLLVVTLLGLISFSILGLGFFWPQVFVSSAVIYVDQQNIIEPLLRGSAEVTRLDQATVARETVMSRTFLLDVGKEANIQVPISDTVDQSEIDARRFSKLRDSIRVIRRGDRLIEVSSRSTSPSEAFGITSTTVAKFIRDSADEKRRESKEAFLFIDNQVKSYKEQLMAAEARLKAFKINNQEGSEDSVHNRLADLRSKIQELELHIEEEKAKKREIAKQLSKESEFLPQRHRAGVYRARLQELRNRLSLLRLDYTETYPDVVSVKLQIESLEEAIREGEESKAAKANNEQRSALTNPLYEDLRLKHSETEVALRVLNKRHGALTSLFAEEQDRLRRVATSNAELAELVRDYDVTKSIYEDMLERKEKARMSMALDIEGQGVSYRIQEPANFPLAPSGLKLIHFAVIGPVVGGLVPIGLLIAMIILDPRIRFSNQIEQVRDIPLMGVISHVNTPLSSRVKRMDVVVLLVASMLLMMIYAGVLISHSLNLI